MFSMENNDNAVDMLQDVRRSDRAFKLPTGNLSFSGTIQLVQNLRPIVDPIAALTASGRFVNTEEKSQDDVNENSKIYNPLASEVSEEISDECTDSIADSQYVDFSSRGTYLRTEDESYSTLDTFNSGLSYPGMFPSEDEEEPAPAPEPFWNFLEDFEQREKRKVQELEEKLRGILPPPSATTIRADVTELLNKYYALLPAFTNEVKIDTPKIDPATPKEMVSSVETSLESEMPVEEMASVKAERYDQSFETKANDKNIALYICTETEAKETPWPETLKRRHYDVYYNLTSQSERLEMLRMRYGQRFVDKETESSISVHSGGLKSPSSVEKGKVLRHKRPQAKSPARRFCNAATIQGKTLESDFKMVDIDINFFLRKELQKEAEEKSRRLKRTQKTTDEKTSGTKTDGTQSDNFLKRKLDMMDDQPETSRSKIAVQEQALQMQNGSARGDRLKRRNARRELTQSALETTASMKSVRTERRTRRKERLQEHKELEQWLDEHFEQKWVPSSPPRQLETPVPEVTVSCTDASCLTLTEYLLRITVERKEDLPWIDLQYSDDEDELLKIKKLENAVTARAPEELEFSRAVAPILTIIKPEREEIPLFLKEKINGI